MIGSLIAIVALIGFLSSGRASPFLSRCSPTTRGVRPAGVYDRALAGTYCSGDVNSIVLSIAVGIGCTFFGLVWRFIPRASLNAAPLLAASFHFAHRYATVCGRLRRDAHDGRSGYVTEFMVEWFGLTNTNCCTVLPGSGWHRFWHSRQWHYDPRRGH